MKVASKLIVLAFAACLPLQIIADEATSAPMDSAKTAPKATKKHHKKHMKKKKTTEATPAPESTPPADAAPAADTGMAK